MTTPTPASTATPTSTTNASSASCTTAVPGRYGNVPIDACNSYYNFNPAFEPAVAVAVIFALLSTAHITLAAISHKRYAWVVIMGALWETISFILHSLGAHDQQNIGYSTGWYILFLLAPLWINAFVYMTLSRMVYYFLPDQRVWIFKGQKLSKYFVWADITTFIIQAAGGVMASPSADPSTIKIGLHVYIAGLTFQQFFIIVFLSLMVVFHRRALELDNASDGATTSDIPKQKKRAWQPLLFALYATLTAITVRIIYRLIEFAGGVSQSNPIPFHEAYSYALDAFPMMVALLILAIVHPGRTLQGPDSEFPKMTRAEKKAAKAARKAAKKTDGKSYGQIELAPSLLSQESQDFDNTVGNARSGNASRYKTKYSSVAPGQAAPYVNVSDYDTEYSYNQSSRPEGRAGVYSHGQRYE